MPTPSDGPDITELVKSDLEARAVAGELTYLTRLKPNNGRDALWDLYEEILDACCYLKQFMIERDATQDRQREGIAAYVEQHLPGDAGWSLARAIRAGAGSGPGNHVTRSRSGTC